MKNLSKQLGIASIVFTLLISSTGLLTHTVIGQTMGSSNSSGSMDGVTLRRSRTYDTPALSEPKSILWQSERLFSFQREQRVDIAIGPSGHGWVQTPYSSSDPIISDGVIYFTVSVSDGNLFAIDAATGKLKTRFKLKGVELSAPAVVGDLIYVGSADGNLMALSRTDNKVRWALAKKGYRFDFTSPFVANGIAYFGGVPMTIHGEGVVAAVDALSGEAKWVFTTKGYPTSAAISGDLMIVGDHDRHVFGVDTKTGTAKWTFKADGQVGPPIATRDLAYFNDEKGRLYAVGITDGEQKWKSDKTIGVNDPLAVDNGIVYAAGGDPRGHYIFAFDASSGVEKWRFKSSDSCSPPVIAGGTVYFLTQHKYLYSLNATDGQLRWKYKMPRDTYASPIIANDAAYLLDDEWYVVAIR